MESVPYERLLVGSEVPLYMYMGNRITHSLKYIHSIMMIFLHLATDSDPVPDERMQTW